MTARRPSFPDPRGWWALFALYSVVGSLGFWYRYLDDLARQHSGTLGRRLLEESTGVYTAFALLPLIFELRHHRRLRVLRRAHSPRTGERAARRAPAGRDGERAYFLAVADIVRAQADRNSVTIHANGAAHSVRTTLDALERSLDPAAFVRVNRSQLIRIDAIRELQTWFHGEYKILMHDGTVANWSRRYIARRPELLEVGLRR